ncbi:MAG: hypothetical protein VB078_00370 [Clostridiaceae bacterium]|nr:hypothetical protein [Clostridiaceae bacterium]
MYSIDQVAAMAAERRISYGEMSRLLGSTKTKDYDEQPKMPRPKTRPVVEFDKYGNTIAEYASIKAASIATGHGQNDILNHCKGNVTYRFSNDRTSFRYANEPMPDEALMQWGKKERKRWLKVEKYDREGRVLAVYGSQNEAAKANNLDRGTIAKYCNGRVRPFSRGKAYAYRHEAKNFQLPSNRGVLTENNTIPASLPRPE